MAQPPEVHHVSGGRGKREDFFDIDTSQSIKPFFTAEDAEECGGKTI
jgi:hypothetical protein